MPWAYKGVKPGLEPAAPGRKACETWSTRETAPEDGRNRAWLTPLKAQVIGMGE